MRVDDIAAHLSPDDPEKARVVPLSLYGLLIGTLQLSRALTGEAVRGLLA